MTVATQSFAAGDTDYITKLNLLHDAIVELQTSGDSGLTPASFLAMSVGMFGSTNICRIGSDSYIGVQNGTVLEMSAGEAYMGDDQLFVQSTAQVDLDFNGLGADTYYVHINTTTGDPEADTLDTEDYLYEVVWDGAAFTSVTDYADEVPGFPDWAGLGSGALWSTSYTIPQRIDAIERMAALMREEEITGTTHSLPEDEALEQDTIRFYGTPGASCTVTIPDKVRSYFIFNETDSSLVFSAGAGTDVTVPTDCMGIFYTDGLTNVTGILVIAMSGSEFVGGGGGGVASTSVYHPVSIFIGGTTGDAKTFMRGVFSHTVTFLTGLSGAYARARVAATAETVFTIKKIEFPSTETTIGTITFAAAATTGVFAFAADVTISEGLDLFIIEGPATGDTTLEDISIAIPGLKPASATYTIASFLPTVLSDGQYLYYGTPTHSFKIEASSSHCFAVAVTGPSGGDVDIKLKKNGSQFGTLTFLSGATTATCSVPVETEIVAGTDIISFEGPASADPGLSGVSVSVRGPRT